MVYYLFMLTFPVEAPQMSFDRMVPQCAADIAFFDHENYMVINKSLSRGLADRILAEYDALVPRHMENCAAIAGDFPRKRPDVQRIAKLLRLAGEKASITQVAGNHPKWRWAVVASFLPLVMRPRDGFEGNRAIRYQLFPIHVHAEKPVVNPRKSATILEVREHAVERLFQRLNSNDPEAVKDEIHDALCLSPHLLASCRSLSLEQVVLPTKSGAFLCNVQEGGGYLTASTWIPITDRDSRRERAAVAIAECHERLGGPRVLAEAIAALPFGENLKQVEALKELDHVLLQFSWFRANYEPGIDHEGEIWDSARAQAVADAGDAFRAAA